MKKSFLLVVVAMFVASLGFAQDAAAPAKKDFVIGVEQLEYLPFYGYDPAKPNEMAGYCREVFDAFAKAKGYNITYRLLPVIRLYAELYDNQIDFKFPDNPKWAADEKKDKTLYYTDSIIDFVDGLTILAENKDLANDKLTHIGTVRGFAPWAYMDRINAGGLKLTEAQDLGQLVKMVDDKRIEGAWGNITVAQRAIKDAGLDPAKFMFADKLPNFSDGSYLLSTTKYPEFIKELNAFLAENKDMLLELRKKYGVKMHGE